MTRLLTLVWLCIALLQFGCAVSQVSDEPLRVPIDAVYHWHYTDRQDLVVNLTIDVIPLGNATYIYGEDAEGRVVNGTIVLTGKAVPVRNVGQGRSTAFSFDLTIPNVPPGSYALLDEVTGKVFGKVDTALKKGVLHPSAPSGIGSASK